MNSNFLKVMLGISFASVFALVVYTAYMVFIPIRTLEVKEAKAVTTELHLGDTFYYTVDYCKYTSAPALVYRTFHKTDEKYIETFPSVETITVPGCAKTQIPLQTPADPQAPLGEYYMIVHVVFNVNPLRQPQVSFKTNNFIIK